MDEATGAPDDYSELYIAYRRMICSVLLRAGISPGDLDDAVSYIMTVLIEKDILAIFDPGRTYVVGTTSRSVRFSALLRRFVALYALQYRDRVVKQSRCVPTENLPDSGVGGFELDVCERHDARVLVASLLAELPDGLRRTVEAVYREPDLTQREVAARLGVCPSTVSHHLRLARGVLEELQ